MIDERDEEQECSVRRHFMKCQSVTVPLFVFPKSLRRTSGSANSSRARYLDRARPKEEANFCDLFIMSYFLSEPCVSWLLCFACNIRRRFGIDGKQQHKNAGTFFLASATVMSVLQFGLWVTMFDYVAFYFLISVFYNVISL